MRTRAALATLAGGAAVAVALARTAPLLASEVDRLRRFARPLDTAASGPVVPPPLPGGRAVTVPAVGELFVRDSGPPGAPVVLLLHGWGVTADVNFFNLYPSLEGAYRVVTMDLRGHGRGLRPAEPFGLEDCADDAAGLLEELGIDSAVVVGYSMGGAVALLLADRHRRRIAGLVLEATALEFHGKLSERGLWRGLAVAESLLRHGSGDGAVQRVLREAVDREPSLEAHRAWIAGELRRTSVPAVLDAGRALSRYDARGFAGRLSVPSAVVLTTRDRLVRPRKQLALAEALSARVFELDGDHDAPIINGPAFGNATRAALDHVTRSVRSGRAPA